MRLVLSLAAGLCLAAAGAAAIVMVPASAGNAAPSGNAIRGEHLFAVDGCYECHGYQGEGGGFAGPKIAPDPPPYIVILDQLRKPARRMPVYTSKVLPDHDVADIYAYLRSIPAARPVADIPMLRCAPHSCSAAR